MESGTETTLLLIEVRFMGIILLPIPMYPDLWELVIITIIICATTMAQIRIKVMDRFPLLIAQAHTMEIFWASKQLRYVLGYTNSIFIFYCFLGFGCIITWNCDLRNQIFSAWKSFKNTIHNRPRITTSRPVSWLSLQTKIIWF